MQWVCPDETPSECVLDMTGSATGELVGVGKEGDVTWWRVREGRGEEGLGISVDDVVIFKKVEMTHELRRFGYGELHVLYMHMKKNISGGARCILNHPFTSMSSFAVPNRGVHHNYTLLYTLSYTLT